MESRAKFLGHPIHQMMVVFPLGLLTTSVVFDIIYLITEQGRWADIAYWIIAAGIIGGVLAAVFGLVDWLAIPANTRAKAIGLYHAIGNAIVLVLFAISWWLRSPQSNRPELLAIILSFMGVALAGVTAWLGGELVVRLGVGVDQEANLNAPSSLSKVRH